MPNYLTTVCSIKLKTRENWDLSKNAFFEKNLQLKREKLKNNRRTQ